MQVAGNSNSLLGSGGVVQLLHQKRMVETSGNFAGDNTSQNQIVVCYGFFVECLV